MNMKNQCFTIFNQRLAGYLMLHGFVLVSMRPDDKSRRNLFFFNDTKALHNAIDEYKSSKTLKEV